MPLFHHPVMWTLGSHCQAAQLAGKTDCEFADIDPFLHLTFGL